MLISSGIDNIYRTANISRVSNGVFSVDGLTGKVKRLIMTSDIMKVLMALLAVIQYPP